MATSAHGGVAAAGSEPEASTTFSSLAEKSGSRGASLRLALDQRRSWVAASQQAGISPPRAGTLGDPTPIPLRSVVHRCLEEWGVDSTDSEDDDDFCGWRVGSRAHMPEGVSTSREPSQRPPAPAGGFGVAVRRSASSSTSASAGGAAAAGGSSSLSGAGSSSLPGPIGESPATSVVSGRPPGASGERPSSARQSCAVQ